VRARCSVSSEHLAASVPSTSPRKRRALHGVSSEHDAASVAKHSAASVPSTLNRQFRALRSVSAEHRAASALSTLERRTQHVAAKPPSALGVSSGAPYGEVVCVGVRKKISPPLSSGRRRRRRRVDRADYRSRRRSSRRDRRDRGSREPAYLSPNCVNLTAQPTPAVW
jgi:hypothetical protein